MLRADTRYKDSLGQDRSTQRTNVVHPLCRWGYLGKRVLTNPAHPIHNLSQPKDPTPSRPSSKKFLGKFLANLLGRIHTFNA